MKTLRLFMVMATIMCSLVANAQDVIVKNDGSTIISKVLEITSTVIKYKKFSNQKGPTYSINKEEVNYINYENGEKEDFGKVSTVTQKVEDVQVVQNNLALQQANNRQVSDVELLKSINIDNSIRKAKKLKKIGWIGGTVFVAAGVVLNLVHHGYDSYEDGDDFDIIGYVSFGVGVVWTTSFMLAANHQKKKALYANTSIPIMQFNLTQSKKSAVYASVNMLNDNMANRKTLGVGMNFNF